MLYDISGHRILAIVLLSTLAIIASTDSLTAQGSKSKRSKRPPQYLTVPMDPQMTSLPPKFQGHDAGSIHGILMKRDSSARAKGEFETTEQFHQRIDREKHMPFFGSVGLESVLAFQLKYAVATYDADRRVMTLFCRLSPVFENNDVSDTKRAASWAFELRDGRSYMGTNAFGATVRVDASQTDYTDIVLLNYKSFPVQTVAEKSPGEMREEYLEGQISIQIDEAKRLENVMGTLLLCKLVDPPATENSMYSRATFDSPHSETWNHHYLNTKLLEVWFYDTERGTILYKIKPLLHSEQ